MLCIELQAYGGGLGRIRTCGYRGRSAILYPPELPAHRPLGRTRTPNRRGRSTALYPIELLADGGGVGYCPRVAGLPFGVTPARHFFSPRFVRSSLSPRNPNPHQPTARGGKVATNGSETLQITFGALTAHPSAANALA